jgi:hypothetical protein
MIKIYITIVFTSICTIVFGQETLQTVTDRGNTTTNSLQIGGTSVNSNTTKLFINNPYGNNWALSSGANMISENGFHIYNWSANPNAPYFSIVNGGNVGIGTVSPDSKLHVYSPVGTVFKALGNSAYLIVDNVGSGENYYSANAGHYFQVNGVNKMILNSGGNLSVNGVGVDGIKMWSTSHPNDYYLSNTWDGTYWQLKSNHPSAVNVGHADVASYSSNSGGLGGNNWSGAVLSSAPSTLIGIDPTNGIYQYNTASLKNWMGLGALAYQNKITNFHSYNNQNYYLIHEWDGTGWNLRSENDANDGQNNINLVNINGKAGNAIKWGGQEFIGSNENVGAFMTNQAGTNFYGYSSISQVKSALATSLQDVVGMNNTITGTELIRGVGDNAYFSAFNPSNTIRSGYVYFGAGDNLTIEAENGANKILLNPNSGGNVGIGTNAPDEKLTVKGKIKANEIKVNGAGAPDYVFEKGYNIGTLEELESYIRANKHLPEVPSAKEFERDGMAVGEMNKLLLKKIEELTLHVIDMNKRVEKLEAENQKLKKNGN